MRRILLASAAASLVLAGCGSNDSAGGSLDDVVVSKSASPKVTVAKGFTATKTSTMVVNAGGGDTLAAGDAVKVNYVAVNGRTGKQFDNSFTSAKPLTITLAENAVLPGFVKGLTGQKVGSRVLVAIPPKDGFGQAQASLDIKADDTMIFLFDVVAKVPTAAAGRPKDLPPDVPQLKLDGDKHPAGFTATSKTKKKQTTAAAYTVIQGAGPKITAEQTVTVQYVGQVYPDGKVFDSSWPRGAFTKPLGELIPCWQSELVGKPLGSRLVLVCPPDTAYAGTESELKADTLIFAIDLLDAS